MRKIAFFLLSLLVCIIAHAQSELPAFSTADSPSYYHVRFKTGSAFLADKGAGNNLQTVASQGDNTSFQFIGSQSEFVMKSKSGNFVALKNEKFITTATESDAAKFSIVSGTATNYWEIQRVGQTKCMNQWGGTGAGKELGEWNKGDGNNQLFFENASLKAQYTALVAQINALSAYKYFYHDPADAKAAVPTTTPTTDADMQTAINNMQTALNNLNTKPLLGTNLDGKQLFMGNKLHTTLFAYAKGTTMGSNVNQYTIDHVWAFEKTNTDGEYYIKNVGQNLYIGAIPGSNDTRIPLVADKNSAAVYTVEASSAYNGYCIIYAKNGTANLETLHMVNWDGVVRWSKTAEASQFLLIDASNAVEAFKKYYSIQNGTGGYASAASGYTDNNGLLLTNSKSPTSTEGMWHLLNNGDGTYRFIVAGGDKAGKVLGMKGSEESARATIVNPSIKADDTEYTTYFNGTFNINSNSPSYIKLASSTHNYFNKRDNYLALWDNASASNNDTGSKFFIKEVVLNDEFLYDEYNAYTAGKRPEDISDFALWYNQPVAATTSSDTWMEYALPLGNGQIGATIRGGVFKDEIQFNEKTLWSGYTTNGSSLKQGYYQNFGSILVTDKSQAFSLSDNSKPVKEYARYLDIINGVAGVNYKSDDENTTYKRRYFVSATDKVLVAHYEATGNNKLKLNFAYVPDTKIEASDVTYNNAGATFKGQLPVIRYNTAFKVTASEGAKITTTEAGILVEDATWANVTMAAATDYDAAKSGCVTGETAEQLASKVQDRITSAINKGYETLLDSHKKAFAAYMNRVDLKIGERSNKTTEELIKYYATAANKTTPEGLYLESLYFQYGRYLTVAANLDTTIHAPSNLQGIWNDRSNSYFWNCDVHADINVEMNYWPADPTNLSEMHLPFVNHIIDLASATNSPWKQLANKIHNGTKGWTVAVENNIFGGTSTWENRRIKTLAAWYCSHLWRYYKYTLDRTFLKKALPVMYDAALFIKDIATVDRNGKYEITNEWSPEHGTTDVTAFGQQTSYELLDEVFKAHKELGTDSPLTEEQMNAIKDLYDNYDKGLWTETYNGKTCISEWKNNALSEPGHRHLSHLLCLYPFSQVSAFDTTESGKKLFQAAYNGMIARNGDVTGWSMGWQTNTYSRCLDGDNAHRNLSLALRHSGSYQVQMSNYGGCYYNLFDAHSPFQIDGNYGCTSGVAEMLLQSYDDVVTILPALPSVWKNGSVKGLKAQGNYTVEIVWANGKATSAKITNGLNEKRKVKVRIGQNVSEYDIDANATIDVNCTKAYAIADAEKIIAYEKALPKNAIGYFGSDKVAALEAAVAAGDYALCQSLVEEYETKAAPTMTAGYYRLINAHDMKYLTPYVNGNNVLMHAGTEAKAVNNVFEVVPTSIDGEFILKVNGKNVSKCYSASSGGSGANFTLLDENNSNEGHFAFENAKANGLFYIAEKVSTTSGQRNYLHENNGNAVGWEKPTTNGEGHPSAWYIVPATDAEVALATVNDASYASVYLPFSVSKVEDAKAYYGVLNDDNTMLNMTETTGIAEGKGVVLIGQAGTAKAILTLGNVTDFESSLTGTYNALTLTSDTRDNYLVFGVSGGNVGFYKPSAKVTTINNNKAFLYNSFGTSAVTLRFGSITAINGVTTEGNKDVKPIYYDLSGRRVVNPTKGVYIMNGHKVMK